VSRSHSPDKTPDQAAGKPVGSSPQDPERPEAKATAKAASAKAPTPKGAQASTGSPGQGSGGKRVQASGGRPGQASGGRGAQGSGGKGGQGKGRPAPGARPGRHRLSAAERAAAKRRRLMRNLIVTAVVVIVAGGIAGLLVSRNLAEKSAIRDLHIQSLPNLGQTHLDPGGKYTKYNSTPPTSGPHDPSPAPCGVTTQPIANEVQVHDLEHGVIMLQYKPGLDSAQVSQLETLGRSYSSHVIVAPYPGLQTAVAATAWTKLMTLDSADTGKLRRFIDLYRQKGPEAGIACPALG
jgi:hypothetical protein